MATIISKYCVVKPYDENKLKKYYLRIVIATIKSS